MNFIYNDRIRLIYEIMVKYVRNSHCCVCKCRLDKVSKAEIRKVTQNNVEQYRNYHNNVEKNSDVIFGIGDYSCGKCRPMKNEQI